MKKEKIVQNRSHVEDRVTVPELIKKKRLQTEKI